MVILDYLGSRLLAHDEDSTGDYLFWSDVNLIPYKGVDPSLGSLPHLGHHLLFFLYVPHTCQLSSRMIFEPFYARFTSHFLCTT